MTQKLWHLFWIQSKTRKRLSLVSAERKKDAESHSVTNAGNHDQENNGINSVHLVHSWPSRWLFYLLLLQYTVLSRPNQSKQLSWLLVWTLSGRYLVKFFYVVISLASLLFYPKLDVVLVIWERGDIYTNGKKLAGPESLGSWQTTGKLYNKVSRWVDFLKWKKTS